MTADNPAPDAQDPAIERMLAQIPDTMAALSREYGRKKDVNSRFDVRQRMKSLLDFMGVDTVFPPNPLVKPPTGPQPARDAAMMAAPNVRYDANATGLLGGAGGFGAPINVAPVPPVVPVPGAPRAAIDNSDILT